MTEKVTLARPYAKAAFEYALEHQALDAWENFLGQIVSVIRDAKVARHLSDPRLSVDTQLHTLNQLLGGSFSCPQKNFLLLVAKAKRLLLVPEMFDGFKHYRNQHDKAAHVEVLTFYPMSPAQQRQLENALQKKLQKTIQLTFKMDQSILGGAVIRIDDRVIDGSVRAKLLDCAKQLEII
jgi:F-type H+-transporting ATPase subunit delta